MLVLLSFAFSSLILVSSIQFTFFFFFCLLLLWIAFHLLEKSLSLKRMKMWLIVCEYVLFVVKYYFETNSFYTEHPLGRENPKFYFIIAQIRLSFMDNQTFFIRLYLKLDLHTEYRQLFVIEHIMFWHKKSKFCLTSRQNRYII